MNDRLEIASRLMAGAFASNDPESEPLTPRSALKWADDLIAEEVRTRPPAADAPAPDDLRAVAETVTWALSRALLYGDFDHSDHAREISAACRTTLARARAIGLGGGRCSSK